MKNNDILIKKKRNIGTIISSIILILCFILFAYVTISKLFGKQPTFFGYSFHYVVTESMSPEINVGDFVCAKKISIEDVEINDYIVFDSEDPNLAGRQIIHKVINKEIIDGKIALTTQGIKDGVDVDPFKVHSVIGKYAFKSTIMGKILGFIKNPINWLFFSCIILIIIYSTSYFKKSLVEYQKEEKLKLIEELKNEIQIENSSEANNTIVLQNTTDEKK